MSAAGRVEELREQAVRLLQAFEFGDALRLLDEALALCRDDTTTELLTLNKATALIELGRGGPEVRALPEILLRRRNPTHAFLAAHNLQVKNLLANEPEESMRFGRIALAAAKETGNRVWIATSLTDLGGAAMLLSLYDESIRFHRRALASLDRSDVIPRVVTLENIGYCYVQLGRPERGIRFIRKALEVFEAVGHETYRCETLLDLCNGYLELGELELARKAGRECLALASEARQVRNCHYLLGEVAMRRGRQDEARRHFAVLAAFYPGFVTLPDLLMSFDIKKLINLKL